MRTYLRCWGEYRARWCRWVFSWARSSRPVAAVRSRCLRLSDRACARWDVSWLGRSGCRVCPHLLAGGTARVGLLGLGLGPRCGAVPLDVMGARRQVAWSTTRGRRSCCVSLSRVRAKIWTHPSGLLMVTALACPAKVPKFCKCLYGILSYVPCFCPMCL